MGGTRETRRWRSRWDSPGFTEDWRKAWGRTRLPRAAVDGGVLEAEGFGVSRVHEDRWEGKSPDEEGWTYVELWEPSRGGLEA